MTVLGQELRIWPVPRTRVPAAIWLPALAVGIGMLLPLVYLLIRSSANGLDGWREGFLNASTWHLLWNTVALAATVTLLSGLLALPLAWFTVRTDLPGRGFWAIAAVLPLVIPSYVGSFAIVSAFGPRGLLQGWLEGLGVERLPAIYGFWGATAALTLFSYPYMLLVLRAAIRGLDPSLEEAGRGLGRAGLRVFLTVVLPQLRPALASGGLLVALYVISDFGAVSILQYDSLTRAVFLKYQSSFDRTGAAVLSLGLVALTLTILTAEVTTRGPARYHRGGAGSARRARAVRLGRGRWPALAFCGLVVGLALVAPLGILIYWLGEGLIGAEPLRPAWSAALHSVYASGFAALLTVLAALPVALMSVRYPGLLSSAVERLSFLSHALPGIVVALSLVFFAARYAPPLYQTIWLLVFAYGVLFLPQAVGALQANLHQVSPHVEDAARSLGRSPIQVAFTVTVPMIRPGIIAGAALVFLTAMKELPATLLLSPTGFPTLATAIWSATSEAFFARAALPSLLLVLLSSLLLVPLLSSERSQTRG